MNANLITSRSVLLRMRNVSDVKKIKAHILFFFENRAGYEKMWKNIVERGRSRMTIWCMRIARWTPQATYTHSEHVIIIAFPLQQWLHGRASMLRSTITECHVTKLAAFLLLHILSVYELWLESIRSQFSTQSAA